MNKKVLQAVLASALTALVGAAGNALSIKVTVFGESVGELRAKNVAAIERQKVLGKALGRASRAWTPPSCNVVVDAALACMAERLEGSR